MADVLQYKMIIKYALFYIIRAEYDEILDSTKKTIATENNILNC